MMVYSNARNLAFLLSMTEKKSFYRFCTKRNHCYQQNIGKHYFSEKQYYYKHKSDIVSFCFLRYVAALRRGSPNSSDFSQLASNL